MTAVLLGVKALPAAVAYDQLISGPTFYIAGFAIGAAFGTRAQADGLTRLRSFVVGNPPLLAMIAGLIVPAAVVPQGLVSASHVVVAVLLPLGFFAVGVSLSAERRAERAPLLQPPDRPVGLALALRFLIAPVVLLIVSLSVLRLPHAYLLQAAMPSGINSLIIAEAYGLDRRLVASAIIWSTAITIAIGLGVAAG
jgi:predicted permease